MIIDDASMIFDFFASSASIIDVTSMIIDETTIIKFAVEDHRWWLNKFILSSMLHRWPTSRLKIVFLNGSKSIIIDDASMIIDAESSTIVAPCSFIYLLFLVQITWNFVIDDHRLPESPVNNNWSSMIIEKPTSSGESL